MVNLLKREHQDPRKHECNFTGKGLNFACPVCGDSDRNPNKKRGHVYFYNNHYKCYNDDDCSMPLNTFLEKFGLDDELTLAERSQLKFISDRDAGMSNTTRIVYGHGKFKEFEKLFFSRALIYKIFGLIDITDSPRAMSIVKSRKVANYWWKYLAYDPKNDEIIILNADKDAQKVISFQRRLLKPNKSNLRYLSMSYKDIILDVLKVDNPDMKKVNFIDKLGGFFNIMNLKWSIPVPVFEGAFDAMMLNNSAATLSASNDIRHPSFHYTYDDDETGAKKAREKIDMGFKVFLWRKFKDDFYELRKDDQGRDIKDFNQLFKKRIFMFEELLPYYSDNSLHKLYI